MKIFLCRHARTNWNDSNLILGQLEDCNVVISKKSEEDFTNKNIFLLDEKVSVIISSDLSRAIKSSSLLKKMLNVNVVFDERFRALNMGAYQGKPISEFISAATAKGFFHDYDVAIPEGESINDLLKRFHTALNDIVKTYPEECNVAIVSHSAAISNIVSYIDNKPYEDITDAIIEVTNNDIKVLTVVKE